MLARMIEDIDDAGCLAGAFVEIRTTRAVVAVEGFLAMLGAERLALALEEARTTTRVLLDKDLDPLDLEPLRDVPASALSLPYVRAQLTRRARDMAAEFPAL